MSPQTLLSLRVRHGASHATIVEAAGEIDLASGPRLSRELSAAVEHGTTVFDAADVSFCDAAGLRILLDAERAAREHDACFRLAAPSYELARTLEIAGAADVFEVFRDAETALKD